MGHNDRVLRALLVWVFLLLLTIAAAWVTMSLVNKYFYGPETDVRAYFKHLQDGDGARALGALNAEVPPETDAALLDGAPLQQATASLEDVSISTISQDSSTAVVRADYTLNGKKHSTDYHLHATETQWGFFTVWAFDKTQLPTVTVSLPGATSADINGASTALPGSTQEFVALLPGIYTASYASEYIDAKPQPVALTSSDQHSTIALKPVPSQAMKDKVSEAITKDLKTCTDQNSLYPTNCPFSYDFNGRVQGTPTWEITDKPTPAISAPAKTSEQQQQWSLSPAQGTASVRFTSVDLYDGSTEEVTAKVPFTYKASMEFTDDGEVTVTR